MLLILGLVHSATAYAESEWMFRRLAGPTGGLGSTDGKGTQAEFVRPTALAFDGQENLWVADSGSHTIRRITPDGTVKTIAGTVGRGGFADGSLGTATIGDISSMAFDRAGNAYLTDNAFKLVRMLMPDGVLTTFAGTTSSGGFEGPANTVNFSNPSGVAVDAMGAVFIADQGNAVISKISGGLVTTYYPEPDKLYQHPRFTPLSLTFDPAGTLIAGGYSSVMKISPLGGLTLIAGSDDNGTADGQGAAAQFGEVSGLTTDPAGNLIVVDRINHSIRRITPTGEVTSIAGKAEKGSGFNV